jgi:hypothetical protein
MVYLWLKNDTYWYYWRKYKTEKNATDAARSILRGEAYVPIWFKRDHIKLSGDACAIISA